MLSPPSSWSFLSLLRAIIHSLEKKASCGLKLKPKVMSSSGHAASTKCTIVRSASCRYVSHLVSRWFPVSPVAASFRGCAHHSPGRRVPHRGRAHRGRAAWGDEHTGDEQHGKEDVKEDVVHLISHKLKCAQGMDVLGWLDINWVFHISPNR